MSKLMSTIALVLFLSTTVFAQTNGRAAGVLVGRMLFYVLFIVGVIFLLRKVLRKKK